MRYEFTDHPLVWFRLDLVTFELIKSCILVSETSSEDNQLRFCCMISVLSGFQGMLYNIQHHSVTPDMITWWSPFMSSFFWEDPKKFEILYQTWDVTSWSSGVLMLSQRNLYNPQKSRDGRGVLCEWWYGWREGENITWIGLLRKRNDGPRDGLSSKTTQHHHLYHQPLILSGVTHESEIQFSFFRKKRARNTSFLQSDFHSAPPSPLFTFKLF